ncbi:MAG: alpha/beta hydrolase [Armatimonadota bacterium]|nr:alpha/beta hydrolase [Armatimonadota bacterium]
MDATTASGPEFIHRFIPAAADSRCTLLLLHGTGGNEDDLLPLGRELAPGAALLSPRGKVLERGMPRFFRRLAEGVFDLDDLRVRTDELAAFVTAAVAQRGLSPDHVVAVGFSNGANIAASLLLQHPGLLRGAVLFRPMVPFEPATLPSLTGTTVFVAAGRSDPLIPEAQTRRLTALLRAGGADVTEHWVAAGHTLTRQEVVAAREWFTTTFPCHPS